MGEFASQVAHVGRSLAARAAAGQAGILSGENPAEYNKSDPIRLWVIQVVIIIAMSQGLSLVLARLRQPRVIAEVIGGILLGPTVMGRIPNFRATIFPEDSMVLLNLTSTIGLVLFLFLVGLEIDTRVIKRNAKASAVISVAGLIVPLGLGAALGVAVYNSFIDPSVNYGYFLLFVAVAVGITAFPVLCRILTELKLLDTTVGVVVLSAGVGNDVVGWILLALTVALVNASTGLTALWVLLVCVGFVLFLLYPVRWGFLWLARHTGSLEQGSPTPFMMTVTLLIVFISAFFTDVIGVHAIFGGFLAGLIIPHENGFAISLVEKLEDLVTILLIPIYFTLSGLRTNLGLLDDGKAWGFVILICVVAFASKFLSCGIAARAFGFSFREAGAIGSLMACKGLVELIVLNVGLQANILNDITFSMFVVHALVLTVVTTPLTLLFYPARVRVHEGAASKPKKSVEKDEEGAEHRDSRVQEYDFRNRFTMVLDRLEQLPTAMTIAKLLQPPRALHPAGTDPSLTKSAEAGLSPEPRQHSISIDTLRLIELTNRTSAVLRSQEAELLLLNDPVITTFKTFGYLNRLPLQSSLSVVNYEAFPSAIASHAGDSKSQMVILPWSRTSQNVTESQDGDGDTHANHRLSFDQTNSVVHSEFVRKVFLNSPTDVALFIDRGISHSSAGLEDQHLFLPFFGGPDDRLALEFVVQLCANPSVKATVLRIVKTEGLAQTESNVEGKGSHLAHNVRFLLALVP
ncbi:hypothetical protein HGRIS_010067 [Hohenbuehelia grisea]|uniref:Cation/H+ exchanger transmembrane domain-containing protein n=1 Tax=Hohenbuehelia grisea TaxID=104357 RepID=A0ABR3J3D8_9AGAR